MSKNLTTKKDFELFEKEAKKWVGIFGLVGWDISFEHTAEEYNAAECSTSQPAKTCIFGLNKKWEYDEVTDYNIRKSAFHEVCELLLAPFYDLARDRYVTEKEFDKERHIIIHVLENVLFDGCQDE